MSVMTMDNGYSVNSFKGISNDSRDSSMVLLGILRDFNVILVIQVIRRNFLRSQGILRDIKGA